jgi:hypothetical protein
MIVERTNDTDALLQYTAPALDNLYSDIKSTVSAQTHSSPPYS